MIRERIKEKKAEKLIKKGASSPPVKKQENKKENKLCLVQLRLPKKIVDRVDVLREKKAEEIGVRRSRHDFLAQAICKALKEGEEEMRI